MSGHDLTAVDAALKQHYTDQRVESMVYKDRPMMALMAKYEAFGGRNLPIVTWWGNAQGRSKTFATAQTAGASAAPKLDDFLLTRVRDYAIATIDNETLLASKGDANAFIEAATVAIDGCVRELSNSIAINMYRDSSGYRGQVNAEPSETSSTFTITLKDAGDIANIEVGQNILIYSAKSGGSQRNSDGSDVSWPVASVNRSAGTLVLTGDYTSSGTIAANDYIFVDGDRGNGIAGLEDWVPASAPSATAFFGVDRSLDSRLGGLRLDGTSGPIEEVLIEAEHIVSREGGKLDHVFLNYSKFAELKKALGSRVQYVDLKAGMEAQISFRGVLLDGAKGLIKVIPDQFCPANRIYGVQLDTWKLYSLGKAVRVIDTDGLSMLRQASSDGVEVRYGFYGNVGCNAPGYNINIQV